MVVLTGMAISTSLVGCCVVQRASADTNDPRWRAHHRRGIAIQEDVSIGIRHMVPVMGTAGWYMKELVKYPPQFKIGFLSNNPPVYTTYYQRHRSC